MTTTYEYTGTLVVIECCRCGTAFGMAGDIERQARNDSSRWFYCPNGHQQHYTTSKVDKLRAQLDQAQADADWQRKQRAAADKRAEHERARANGYKGALVKTKKRIGKGVCPCCNRHFANVERHMASQHPGFGGADEAQP